MLRKIISGGQTGVDRAALDAAIEAGIDHGGWIPKGRLTEDGPLPEKYNLKEMPSSSYPKRTEQNVIDSDGTLVFSRGKLTGGSLLTQKMAMDHDKHVLHMDLEHIDLFGIGRKIIRWLQKHDVEVLNVAGPRSSKDPKLYKQIFMLLVFVFQVNYSREGYDFSGTRERDVTLYPEKMPKSVDEAVDDIISSLSLRERTWAANIGKEDFKPLDVPLASYVRDRLRLWSPNKELLKSCRKVAGEEDLDVAEVPGIIIREVWRKLQEIHRLRVVK